MPSDGKVVAEWRVCSRSGSEDENPWLHIDLLLLLGLLRNLNVDGSRQEATCETGDWWATANESYWNKTWREQMRVKSCDDLSAIEISFSENGLNDSVNWMYCHLYKRATWISLSFELY